MNSSVSFAAENSLHDDGKLDQAMKKVRDPNSFESFLHSNPSEGEYFLKTVVEVTGITDRTVIYKALDQSRKSSNSDFDLNNAIEWILPMLESSDEQISTSDQTTGTSTSISPDEMAEAEATGASTMATPPSTTAGTTFGKIFHYFLFSKYQIVIFVLLIYM